METMMRFEKWKESPPGPEYPKVVCTKYPARQTFISDYQTTYLDISGKASISTGAVAGAGVVAFVVMVLEAAGAARRGVVE